MIIKGSNDSGDYAQPPAGTHVARCYRLLDLGTQVNEFEGQKTTRRQVVIGWELCEELMEDGQPFTIVGFFTASLHPKATLRHYLENWRGRAFSNEELEGFELRAILGTLCQVMVVINDKGRAKVTGVAAVPKCLNKKSKTLAPVNEQQYFSLEPDEYDADTFEHLSDGFKRMIQASPEWQALQAPMKVAKHAAPRVDDLDDVDFSREPDGSEGYVPDEEDIPW